jgi:hypothetical protein
VHPEELNKMFVWDVALADLNDGVNTSRIVHVAGEKAALDTLSVYEAYVGCSVGLCKVPVEVNQKPMTTRCMELAAVQVGNSLDFVALRAEIRRRNAVLSFAYADG